MMCFASRLKQASTWMMRAFVKGRVIHILTVGAEHQQSNQPRRQPRHQRRHQLTLTPDADSGTLGAEPLSEVEANMGDAYLQAKVMKVDTVTPTTGADSATPDAGHRPRHQAGPQARPQPMLQLLTPRDAEHLALVISTPT